MREKAEKSNDYAVVRDLKKIPWENHFFPKGGGSITSDS